MGDYLPQYATTDEASAWLTEETGERWSLARLLECELMPWIKLDYSPDAPQEIFGGRLEGYLAPMVFSGDTQMLAVDKTNVIMTMTKTHDGKLIQITPGLPFDVSELRFKRDDLERLAGKQTTVTGAKVEAVQGMDWVTQAQAIAKAFLSTHWEKNLFPSQKDVCKHVEKITREQKIFGTHGKPLEASYILRNAIQGPWWKKNYKS